MSADQWSHCPRCTKERETIFANLEQQVNASYGKVPVEEFDQARADLEVERERMESAARSWREDFNISGAEEGTVQFSYRGGCSVCKLRLEFKAEKDIPGL